MKVYFIPGLGADRRIFNHTKLPYGYEPVFMDWKKPDENDTLEDYARRMAAEINEGEPFVLVGLSMGGMIATEISKFMKPEKLILLSSAGTRKELPAYFNFVHKYNLHRYIPAKAFTSASLIKRFFTVETAEDKALLREIIRDTDPAFVQWALGAILNWKNETLPEHCYHIHGDRDEILPLKYTHATHIIPKGTHMMVLTRAGEVNDILAGILQEDYSQNTGGNNGNTSAI